MSPEPGEKAGGPTPVSVGGVRPTFMESAADAMRYWEPRRLIYNLGLLAVVAAHFLRAWPASRTFMTWDMFFGLFLLAVVANLLYCAAYGVDLFVQFSALRAEWPRRRWIVLVTGTAFAAAIAHFVTMGLLGSSSN